MISVAELFTDSGNVKKIGICCLRRKEMEKMSLRQSSPMI